RGFQRGVSPAGSVGDGRSPLATIAPFEMRCIEFSPPPVAARLSLLENVINGRGQGVGTCSPKGGGKSAKLIHYSLFTLCCFPQLLSPGPKRRTNCAGGCAPPPGW